MHVTSPRRYARFAGLLYLLIIATGIFGELFIRASMVVPGDAAATLARIATAPGQWRLGIALDLLMHVCDVFVMWGIYVLLRPVSRPGALLVLLFNLVQTAVLVANKLLLFVPVLMVGQAPSTGATVDAGLALLAIRLHEYGFGVGLVFFGFVCLLEGRLIRRSGFLPRWIGALMQLAGACYLANSLMLLLDVPGQSRLFPLLMLPVFVGELSFALWLTIKGVDEPAWRRLASAH